MNVEQLEEDVKEWLETLDDDSIYWDGICQSDQGMARSFILDGRVFTQSFVEWIKNKYA